MNRVWKNLRHFLATGAVTAGFAAPVVITPFLDASANATGTATCYCSESCEEDSVFGGWYGSGWCTYYRGGTVPGSSYSTGPDSTEAECDSAIEDEAVEMAFSKGCRSYPPVDQ